MIMKDLKNQPILPCRLKYFFFFYANSVDPDETAHNETSHHDIHCLTFSFDFWLRALFEIMVLTGCEDQSVHFWSSGLKGLIVLFLCLMDLLLYCAHLVWMICISLVCKKKTVKRKVKGVPQSQTAALPRHQEEEETNKTKQAQIKQTYET